MQEKMEPHTFKLLLCLCEGKGQNDEYLLLKTKDLGSLYINHYWKHPNMPEDLMLPWRRQKYQETHTYTSWDRQRDVGLNCGCLHCYSENKRRIWRAKYRNRIMSFLSSASIVSTSPLLSSSLNLPSLLTGPNISLGPLSWIKEIYYTRDFRLYGGSEQKKTILQILEESSG